jgi:hypothetical protein
MSVIAKIRADRQLLARAMEKHKGIRRIVEDLYPDSVHFIYELLQNAEDTGATAVTFSLSDSSLVFEHDGRPFNEADIAAITDIADGTKADDEDTIGRFGIGFKAVFAYTETPRIWSGEFAFEIKDLVLPSELSARAETQDLTRFEFPFDHKKKDTSSAFTEIASRLEALTETTLLFLSNIRSISWQVAGKKAGVLTLVDHSEHHIETQKKSGERTVSSSNFLRFVSPVEGLSKQNVAVAFVLEPVPGWKRFDAGQALREQFSIAAASPGCVAVFFPARKETSGLRFHLHAPFVPELSRASIKDTSANTPLFEQLARESVHALHEIRDLGLLTGNFLGVLPNPADNLPDRYECIRETIVGAMNAEHLTPVHGGGHAAAVNLLQARASLKSVLSRADLELLVEHEGAPYRWAVGASQRNSSVDRFLKSLQVRDWDIDEFVGILEARLTADGYYDDDEYEWVDGPAVGLVEWLAAKPDRWHQQLYALLYRELEPEGDLYQLKDTCIVRLSSGKYHVGGECYFPGDDQKGEHGFPRVAEETYTSGKSASEKSNALKFLQEMGVREVGEYEEVEAILKLRYTEASQVVSKGILKSDLRRFIAFVEADKKNADLLENYWIFERDDGAWARPEQVYLDTPFVETGLCGYYSLLGKDADRELLAPMYLDLGMPAKKIVDFAKALGVGTQIEIAATTCWHNPQWRYLREVGGIRRTSSIDKDYEIPHLGRLLGEPTVEQARLMWKTLCGLPRYPNYLQAKYQINEAHGCRIAASQLVYELRKAPWVPQGAGDFVRPSEASQELLPEGFPFDAGWAWIKAVQFGEEVQKRSEEGRRKREVAKELGFTDDKALGDAKWFAALSLEERQQFKREYQARRDAELPDHESGDPARRAARVGEQAADAPHRVTEPRTRAVSVGRDAVKKDTDPYLRHQYTNDDGETICQVCKEELPFKLSDGQYYFEAVEFLPELTKRHFQNYLSLCPNHAAMVRFANGTRELVKDLFVDLVGQELEVVLADENATIYFTQTHIADLTAIVRANDADESNLTETETSAEVAS